MHIPILGYGILFAIHSVLEVALPKHLVKGPESARFSSSIPIPATLLALNGVLYSVVPEIVKVVAIISGVVSEAVFTCLRVCWLRGRRLAFLFILVPNTVTKDMYGMFRH